MRMVDSRDPSWADFAYEISLWFQYAWVHVYEENKNTVISDFELWFHLSVYDISLVSDLSGRLL